MTELLDILNELPGGLLDCEAQDLHRFLTGPTLIHLPGRNETPLFVSVLLHGNEPVGWQAVQMLLKKYQGKQLPRALSLFIGNVSAARDGLRRLDGQPDYNRIWCEPDEGEMTDEHCMARDIVSIMADRGVFASIDIHNNTGLNPHYGCINKHEHAFMWLATQFSRTVVYFIRPKGVQTSAFAGLCPAVTVECGQPGQQYGVEHAAEFLNTVLHMNELPNRPVPEHDIDLFHTVAIVKVPEQLAFSFEAGSEAAICFIDDLDHMNFRELSAGTTLAMLNEHADGAQDVHFNVVDDDGNERWQDYFQISDGEIRTTQPVMPSMLTLDERVIRQDCLCYLMERMPLPK